MTFLLLTLLFGAQEATPQTVPIPAERADLLPAGFVVTTGESVAVAHSPRDSLMALRVLRELESQIPLPAIPRGMPGDVMVVLAPDEATFQRAAGGAVPGWGAAVALPRAKWIVYPLYGERRGREEGRILRHEWAHLALHERVGGLRIPRWFDEGYAQWASGGWDFTGVWKLRIAFAAGDGPSLDSLTLIWPRARAQAELAYLLSATAVEYLTRESGPRGLDIFFDRWRDSRDFEGALRETYGMTLGQFEEGWARYVKKRYGWLLVLSHSVVFWAFLALVLLGMVWLRRGHNRQRMAELRARDVPDAPDFWNEEAAEEGDGHEPKE